MPKYSRSDTGSSINDFLGFPTDLRSRKLSQIPIDFTANIHDIESLNSSTKSSTDGHREPDTSIMMCRSYLQEIELIQSVKASWFCFWCCFAASMGGFCHGFHNSIMSTISNRVDYQKEFFQDLLNKPSPSNIYCFASPQRFTLLTSSLFFAALVSDITGIPAYFNRHVGRLTSIQISASLFVVATILLASSISYEMIFISRCIAGVAISFETISVLLYLSEVSPCAVRGKYNQLFEVQITAGILLSNILNYSFRHVTKSGSWRWICAFGIPPSLIYLCASFIIADSPSSLMERGKLLEGRTALAKARIQFSPDEYELLFKSAERSRNCTRPWRYLLTRRELFPQVCLAFMSTFFRQFTGISFVIIYGPQLFTSILGSKEIAAWISLMIYFFNHFSTYISYFLSDICGRRPLLMFGGIQMLFPLLVIPSLLISISQSVRWLPWLIMVLVCVFDIGYGYSWGPIGWLYPTETQYLETRSSALTVASAVNLFLSFINAQFSLSILCAVKSALFYFFAFMVFTMTTTVFFLFPETKNIPVEKAWILYENHPIWKRFAADRIR